MSDTSDSETQLTPPEISAKPHDVTNNLLLQKSRNMYQKFYTQFMDWRKSKCIASFSENIFLVYFEELSQSMKPSTLWTHYSILKSTLNIKHQIDLSKYSKLKSLLKRKSKGYKGKKSKTFSPDELNTFLNEAPDTKYLMIKVATIFGIMGACRRHELHELKVNNVKDIGSTIVVTIPNTKTKSTRTFKVTGKYYETCQKYINLRPKMCNTASFFINYQNGKCTVQNVGLNKLGNMGKQIALYLNLPNSNLYTGHCFRRSSATILVDAGGDIRTLKRHEGWKSTTVAEAYIDSGEDENDAATPVSENLNTPSTTNYEEEFSYEKKLKSSSDTASEYMLQKMELELAQLRELHQLKMQHEEELHQRRLLQIENDEIRTSELYELQKQQMKELHDEQMKALYK